MTEVREVKLVGVDPALALRVLQVLMPPGVVVDADPVVMAVGGFTIAFTAEPIEVE